MYKLFFLVVALYVQITAVIQGRPRQRHGSVRVRWISEKENCMSRAQILFACFFANNHVFVWFCFVFVLFGWLAF